MANLITVELFSNSSCHRCDGIKSRVRPLINEFGKDKIDYQELEVLTVLDYAVSLGVLTTPAIAINGKLVFAAMPSLKQLRNELQKRLKLGE